MVLNEFLKVKLGVDFEDKYNALAVREILENREKYPLTAPFIAEAAEDSGEEWNYEHGFFDCDDVELCANDDETLELYRAFVAASATDGQDHRNS